MVFLSFPLATQKGGTSNKKTDHEVGSYWGVAGVFYDLVRCVGFGVRDIRAFTHDPVII